MSIEKQKDIANIIYDRLRLADPHCILAGGAPRDWYFGKEAKDLDFYFVSTTRTIRSTRKQLEALLGKEVSLLMDKEGHRPSELYQSMPNLIRIWEVAVEGVPVQLIQLCSPGDQWKVVDNMDVSICKAWYLPEQGIKLHTDFKLTVASGIMFLKDNYAWDMKHAQKMLTYFKGQFGCGNKDQATQALVNKALKAVEWSER